MDRVRVYYLRLCVRVFLNTPAVYLLLIVFKVVHALACRPRVRVNMRVGVFVLV